MGRQYRELKPEIDQAIQRVLDRGDFILGPEVGKFEEEFASFCGAAHAVGVGSGTEALTIALKAVDVGIDDEVVTVPNTFVATVEAICNVGALPALVDVNADTYTMDAAKLGDAHIQGAKAVVPVHLYGHPANMYQIREETKLPIVADCYQAHGAVYGQLPVGLWQAVSAFSFYPSKNLGAYGDGGALVTDDYELAEWIRWLRNHGEGHVVGYNSRLDELQAAVLRVKLRYLDAWTARRREIAETYNKLLGDLVHTPVEGPSAWHVYHLYVIEVDEHIRDDLV
ncbi:unnamed protein product, partial [marine sediment metagenome]